MGDLEIWYIIFALRQEGDPTTPLIILNQGLPLEVAKIIYQISSEIYSIFMILFLFGQDTYRSRQRLKEIIEEYKRANPNWLDFNKIDAGNPDINIFDEFRRSIDTVSMFGNKKLIIIESIFSASEWHQNEVLIFFKKRNLEQDKDIAIIFWVEEADSKSALFNFLKQKAKIQEFNYLQGFQLKDWISDYISRNKGKIENSAVEKLIQYIGSDLWRMSNELDKLLSYNKLIKVENIEFLIKPEVDLNIFEMVDALGQKNKSKALKLFNQHLKKGEDEFYLFSMFIYQIRNLLKVKTGGGKDLHPFVFKKTQLQAKNFSFEELKKIYRKLLEIDLDVKTGKTDIKTALEMFIVAL